MSIKGDWVDEFVDKLYEYHGKNYKWFIEDRNYPLQLAVAYFDWGSDGVPECTVNEAFERYLENQDG